MQTKFVFSFGWRFQTSKTSKNLSERVPGLAERVLQELEGGASQVHCVAQATAAEAAVHRPAFPIQPTWRELADGVRPPEPLDAVDDEPGMWPHGWQLYAPLGLIIDHRGEVKN